MVSNLIERVKITKTSLSSSLRDDLINAGEVIVKPLIKLLPSLTSYVVTADAIEVLGNIGGNEAYKALSTLLEDAPPGNLPKRLISQSCIRGLTTIGNESSVSALIEALSFKDIELRYTIVDSLTKIALVKAEFRPQITEALHFALQHETFEKPGRQLEDSLEKLGQPVNRRETWPNTPRMPLVIDPAPVSLPPPAVIKPVGSSIGVVTQQSQQTRSLPYQPLKANLTPPQPIFSSSAVNKYVYLTEEQQKEILEKLLTSPEEKEKLEIIDELGQSGNIQVIDELLTVIKSTDNRKIKQAAVDAIINIAPNDLKIRFLVLEYILDKRVIGQVEAKLALANALRVAQIGLKRAGVSTKPVGSFLFLGPTGVGKTELAKALAEALYGNELQLIRLDMSEYTDMADKNKLIGSPPGYAGCDEGGRLTQAVLKQPQSVVLFDEIEKAHNEIFNLFLQVMDDGRLTDSKGITVSFRDTIIIMTSNVGSEYILDGINAKLTLGEMKEIIQEVIKTKFKPEFLNRLNDYIIFKPLTSDELLQVLNLKLKPTANGLYDKYQLTLEVTDAAKNFIIESTQKQEFGFSPRELNRIIDNEIVQPLSEKLLDLEISESYRGKSAIPRGGKVVIDLKDSKLSLDIVDSATKGV